VGLGKKGRVRVCAVAAVWFPGRGWSPDSFLWCIIGLKRSIQFVFFSVSSQIFDQFYADDRKRLKDDKRLCN
jgi:hypothetical protein